jgi:hypothetical protein
LFSNFCSPSVPVAEAARSSLRTAEGELCGPAEIMRLKDSLGVLEQVPVRISWNVRSSGMSAFVHTLSGTPPRRSSERGLGPITVSPRPTPARFVRYLERDFCSFNEESAINDAQMVGWLEPLPRDWTSGETHLQCGERLCGRRERAACGVEGRGRSVVTWSFALGNAAGRIGSSRN